MPASLLPCFPTNSSPLGPPLPAAGESYAGHYVPAVASAVFHASKSGQLDPPVNLQGLAIGNGLTDPAIQYGAYSDYALMNGLIGQAMHDRLKMVGGVGRPGWGLRWRPGWGLGRVVYTGSLQVAAHAAAWRGVLPAGLVGQSKAAAGGLRRCFRVSPPLPPLPSSPSSPLHSSLPPFLPPLTVFPAQQNATPVCLQLYPACRVALEVCDGLDWAFECLLAVQWCQMSQFAPVMLVNEGMNVYDIRKKCEGPLCYRECDCMCTGACTAAACTAARSRPPALAHCLPPACSLPTASPLLCLICMACLLCLLCLPAGEFEVLDRYLNQPSVRKALGVGDIEWESCNMDVHSDMMSDW